MAEIDLSTMTMIELNDLRLAVVQEVDRRAVIAESEEKIEDISYKYLQAVGKPEGSDWVQPEGAHNAYPAGYVTTHNGKEWRSLVGGNVWEPGTSAWREVVPEGAVPPEWVQPTGEHDSYAENDKVTFDGAVWISLTNGNVWSPSIDPTLWMPEDPNYYEPEPEPPVEEPAPPETAPDFVQPTGAHDAYAIGDKVTFEGNVYQSLIDNNTYSPSAYPAGWELIS